MSKITKNLAGVCPYCANETYALAANQPDHSDRESRQCNSCNRHYVRLESTGVSYPLINYADPVSAPCPVVVL